MADTKDQMLFAITNPDETGAVTLILLIPNAVIREMKAGIASDADLRKAGFPFKLIVGTCIDRADGLRIIGSAKGVENAEDRTGEDWSIPGIPR